MRKYLVIIAAVIATMVSCAPRYAYDPYDEYDEYEQYEEMVDVTTREEVRDIRGEFWCNGYGNYFEDAETGEIWCTFGGGLCPKYEAMLQKRYDETDGNIEGVWVEVVLSGSVGYYIDDLYELDCSRIFYVTVVHEMRLMGGVWY